MVASQNNNNQKMLTTDGIPLKKKLSKALFRSRLRAFGLVTPLLLLISIGFVFPIIVFLTRGVREYISHDYPDLLGLNVFD